MKPDCPLFGTEALIAISAGVPVLVSGYSGIAQLLKKMAEDEPVVYGTKLESPLETWKERILEKITQTRRITTSSRKAQRTASPGFQHR